MLYIYNSHWIAETPKSILLEVGGSGYDKVLF